MPVTPKEPDQVEQVVLAAIVAVQSRNQADIANAYNALGPLNTGDVIAELFLWVDDLTTGVDETVLLDAAELPMFAQPTRILRAVYDRDLADLQDAVGSVRLEKVLASLLVLVAALKDARATLQP